MKTKSLLLAGSGLVLGLAGAALAAIVLVQAGARSADEALPVLYDVPPFALTDSDGAAFTQDRLQGKVWVVDFIFTTCTGPCPVMTGRMAALHSRFGGNDRVRLVSISVDPATDTPPVLKAYAASIGADTARWHFLTGPDAEVQRLAREGFKLGSGDTPLLHDTRFVLVDARGRVRGYYTGTNPGEVDRLSRDIGALLGEEAA